MLYNVAQLLKQQVGEQRSYEIYEPPMDLDDVSLAAPVTGTVKLTKIKQGVVAAVTVETAMRLECSRCLEPFVYPFSMKYEETFVPTFDIHTGLPVTLVDIEDRSSIFRLDAKHNLDLSETLRQQALLVTPMMPLHDVACAGLCPQCGADLNVDQTHSHAETWVDQRLQALSRLLEPGDPGVDPPKPVVVSRVSKERRA